MPKKTFTDEQRQWAIEQYVNGISTKTLAKKLDCSRRTVWAWVTKYEDFDKKALKNFFSPIPKPKTRQRKLANGNYKYTEIGLVKKCNICQEYWPADTQFFYADKYTSSGLMPNCIACFEEKKRTPVSTLTNPNPLRYYMSVSSSHLEYLEKMLGPHAEKITHAQKIGLAIQCLEHLEDSPVTPDFDLHLEDPIGLALGLIYHM